MSELETIALEPVDRLTITTLVGDVTDIPPLDDGPGRRPPFGSGPRVPAAEAADGRAAPA